MRSRVALRTADQIGILSEAAITDLRSVVILAQGHFGAELASGIIGAIANAAEGDADEWGPR